MADNEELLSRMRHELDRDRPFDRALAEEAIEALSRDTESGWRVKPIEWQPNGQNTDSLYSGELIFNTYYVIDKAGPIWRAERDQFLSERGKDEVASGADLEAVKAMVQRDYENLIAPALLPTPPKAKTP